MDRFYPAGQSSNQQRPGAAPHHKDIFESDTSMRSDVTLISSSEYAGHGVGQPLSPTPQPRNPYRKAQIYGDSDKLQYSLASPSHLYEFYQPSPDPQGGFFQDNSEDYTTIQDPPLSPTLSDGTFRSVTPSAIDLGAYPLTKVAKSNFDKMASPTQTAFPSTFYLEHPSASSRSMGDAVSEELDQGGRRKKDCQFWIIFTSLMVVCILTALDMTMISTALPGIVRDLPVSTVSGTWVTSAYLLTMTASQPAFGGFSCVAGRRWSLTLAVTLFLAGSIACALSRSLLALSISRGLQGLGGGGIQAVGEIIVSDLTTLRERGFFIGLVGLVFAISSFIAPVLGGIFSSSNWRWIFWINLPIGAVSLVLIIPFMNLSTPQMAMKEKIQRMDLVGNLVLFGSVVGILIGVTEGGINHPWSDIRVWLPLAVGLDGFLLFLAIEFIPNPLCRSPVLPLKLFSNRTAASAFFMTFVHGMITYGAIYILPVFFQAIKDESPLRSAISTFPATAPGAPFAIIAGITMAVTGRYKAMIFIGWILMCGGFGWMTRFQTETPTWELYSSQVISGTAVGMLFAITLPPIQASLPASELELATATFAFCRSFGSIWGIAGATTIFTSSVAGKLKDIPAAAQFGLTGQTALGFVEEIRHLPDSIREPVRQVFADGLQNSMWFFVPLAIVGFLSSFFIKELPLPDFVRSEVKTASEEKEAASRANTAGSDASFNRRPKFGGSGSAGKEHDLEAGNGTNLLRSEPPIGPKEKDVQYQTGASCSSPPSYDHPAFRPAGRSTEGFEDEGPTLAPSEVDLDEKTPRASDEIQREAFDKSGSSIDSRSYYTR